MRVTILRRKLSFGIVAAAVAFSHAAFAAVDAPYSTPLGITLLDVNGGGGAGGGGSPTDQVLWRRLGDADGKPLYTFDNDGAAGKSTCVAECAKEFPPYLVAKGAVAFGSWSIFTRDDGGRQWVYEGRPLYRYSGEDPVPQARRSDGPVVNAAVAAPKPSAEAMDPGSKLYAPKEGWKRAIFFTGTILTPPEFELRSIATANGYAFNVVLTGKILYVFKTAPKRINDWAPAYAAGLAREVGDFSIIEREDGKRQWAYKRQPLYTYNEDYTSDDINGLLAQNDAQVALAFRNYMPPAMTIKILPFRGPIIVTAQGMTVYVQTRNRNQYGGRESRGGYRYLYSEAKLIGTQGCVNECLNKWKPVVAPANAQASGFWEIATRADGTRQWMYKGAALYTFVADKNVGDNKGNNIHEIVYGTGANEDVVKLTGGDGKGVSGSGFYWHTVPFFN